MGRYPMAEHRADTARTAGRYTDALSSWPLTGPSSATFGVARPSTFDRCSKQIAT